MLRILFATFEFKKPISWYKPLFEYRHAPATSKIEPTGLYLNAIEPDDILDQVAHGKK